MAGRRPLIAIVCLAATLHAVGIARSLLPAQDGLKFLRTARAFQTRPWGDVVRASDQHPLYTALVAMTEPAVAFVKGRGPGTWTLAAQLVAAVAAVSLLVPLHGLTTRLFDARVADLAALGFVLLPLPMAVGHDTLSDSLALCAFLITLRLGVSALEGRGVAFALGCGLAAGIGFLARPEVLVAPLAVGVTGALGALGRKASTGRLARPRLAALGVAFLSVVGAYAIVKGEVSEKLAMRPFSPKTARVAVPKRQAQWLPPGLDDPRWNFAPKEEPAEVPRRGLRVVTKDLASQWAEGLGVVLAFFAVWGVVRDRHIRAVLSDNGERADDANTGRHLIIVYLLLFALVLVRHEMRMGYLSGRHVLTLVVASLPWAAAGVFICARGVAVRARWSPRVARGAGVALVFVALATSIAIQAKPAHPSRWGHLAAGRWLIEHSRPDQSVLDTRGWAAFVSERNSYDYWHVRQAVTDSSLAYVVVGDDELRASSSRAATLRAMLAYAASPVAAFPERAEEGDVGVWIYRYRRPESWEGMRP